MTIVAPVGFIGFVAGCLKVTDELNKSLVFKLPETGTFKLVTSKSGVTILLLITGAGGGVVSLTTITKVSVGQFIV